MYLKWNEKNITDFADNHINSLYNEGYVFTRVGKGVMNQTRSLRVDLSNFELTSENRRVLKKTEGLEIQSVALPYSQYDWTVGKMAKDFYDTKFGDKTFSANKIKELLTDDKKSNFNLLFLYTVIPVKACPRLRSGTGIQTDTTLDSRFHGNDMTVGYAICRETNELLHYS